MKKINFLICIYIILSIILTACNTNSESNFSIAGSTSVESLAKSFSEAYREKDSSVSFSFQGGGSGAAIKNVVDGVATIGALSRNLKDNEKEKNLKEYIIAIDGISIVVNPKNSVTNLATEQIKKIFMGEIKNWKEVGGEDKEIVTIGREAGSGTRDGFESILEINDKTKYKVELNETGQVKAQVASTEGAIGYMSTGYIDSSIKGLNVDGIDANKDNIQSGIYKIQRPFIMVLKPDNYKDSVKSFIDFILSDEGKKIVETKGFISPK